MKKLTENGREVIVSQSNRPRTGKFDPWPSHAASTPAFTVDNCLSGNDVFAFQVSLSDGVLYFYPIGAPDSPAAIEEKRAGFQNYTVPGYDAGPVNGEWWNTVGRPQVAGKYTEAEFLAWLETV